MDSGKGGAILFKVVWDKETGGVKLQNKVTSETLSVSPRPVFFEELDLLKMSNYGWQYPTCQEPLLWACNKQYFYRGELVFEVKGANIYDAPTVILQTQAQNLKLVPVDVAKMLEECNSEMFLAESEAIEFIRDVYVQYADAKKLVESIPSNQLDYEALVAKIEKETKQRMAIVKQDCDSFDIMPLDVAKEKGKRNYQTTKIDVFLASFSGGKDSQVVLDLCTRAIPPTAFQVIYSDTGYELPTSLELYEEVKRHYGEIVPDLKFSTSRNHESVLNYWDKIGTPSDTHRWCCSIMKTAPLYRMLKIEGTNKQARVLTFDGVRAEESVKRSTYSRIGKGVKHNTVINASPILNWSTVEVFLYLFKHNLPINTSYRLGMTRVGCLICPFSSEWNDMISHHCYSKSIKPFINRIEDFTTKSGVEDVKDYIREGKWKRRAGGRGLSFPSYLEVLSTNPHLKVKCYNPQQAIDSWLFPIGPYTISEKDGHYVGELNYKKDIISFSIEQNKNVYTYTFEHTSNQPTLQGLIKRVLYKTTYCINCETCEVECPTGALSIIPKVSIDKSKCIHCEKCLSFHNNGCIVASSLNITGNNSKNMKLISYNNFGLKEEWLDMYMSSIETYFEDNMHGLNVKEQLPNFVKWLVQSEILLDSKTKQVSNTGRALSDIYRNNPDLVWEIIWINLSYNSPIAKWYKENIDWNQTFTQSDLVELVRNDYPSDSEKTIKNILYALFRTFRESPIGQMGLLNEIDKNRFRKEPSENISREAVAYSLYKFAEYKNIKSFRVSDLYDKDEKSGINKEFGISKSTLEKHLRSLNSEVNRLLVAELNMGLDHITLRDDLTSIDILNIINE